MVQCDWMRIRDIAICGMPWISSFYVLGVQIRFLSSTTRTRRKMVNKMSSKPVRGKQRRDMIHDLLSRCTCYGPPSDDAVKAIISLVTAIIATEKRLVRTELPDRVDKFGKFIAFCHKNGVDTSNIEVVSSGSDYGLHAKRPLRENESVMCIPRQMILTAEQLSDDAAFREFVAQDPLVKEMPNLLLVMILIREFCDKDSFWKPYMDILPSAYETPLYMDYEMLCSLKPSPAFQEAAKLYRNICRQYAYFWTQMHAPATPASRLPFRHLFTFELYRWAVSSVMTRQNLIPSSDGGHEVNALIPLWDLCNHSVGKFSTDFAIERNAIICYAMQNFPVGSEIKIFYGGRSNEEFLIHNGFVHTENPSNHLSLTLGISRSDRLANLRSCLCSKSGVPASGKFRLYHKDRGLDTDLFCFLRIFLLNAEQLEYWSCQSDLNPLKDPEFEPLSELNSKMEAFLRTRASLLLQTYPNDEEVAKIANAHILRLMADEKEILQSHIS